MPVTYHYRNRFHSLHGRFRPVTVCLRNQARDQSEASAVNYEGSWSGRPIESPIVEPMNEPGREYTKTIENESNFFNVCKQNTQATTFTIIPTAKLQQFPFIFLQFRD